MQFNNRNERKVCILNILSYYSDRPYTSKEIHGLCSNVSLNSLRTSLKTYYIQGLLKRKKIDGVFCYKITKGGLKRLEYLIGSKSEKDKIDLLIREPVRKIKNEIRLLAREKIKI